MTHRLITEEGAPWQDPNTIIHCENAEAAFVRLVIMMQSWEPLLAQLLIMTAFSNRGLREMELLSLIDSLNQSQDRIPGLIFLFRFIAFVQLLEVVSERLQRGRLFLWTASLLLFLLGLARRPTDVS